jgi:ubiquinone/menaquinone biosynthesis C-methylase UbiE
MKWILPQTDREELLDLHRGTLTEVRRSLHDIRRINAHLGGARVVLDATFNLLRKHNIQNATILDIGTGCADIPLHLIEHAEKHDLKIRVLALDNNARHLKIAREDLTATNKSNARNIHLLQADAFRLPLPDNSVDVVVSSLFLHHFRSLQIVELLREFHRVSRVGWAMNDLVRHLVPLVFFRLTKPVFARSYITRHDGEASLRRGYTTEEMKRIVAPIRGACLQEHFPFRMSIVCEKCDSLGLRD